MNSVTDMAKSWVKGVMEFSSNERQLLQLRISSLEGKLQQLKSVIAECQQRHVSYTSSNASLSGTLMRSEIDRSSVLGEDRYVSSEVSSIRDDESESDRGSGRSVSDEQLDGFGR